jgi:glycogen debranching enzyme/NAD(P)-dependent dehydrogenase (short-subunit alcohol dehydrogenase family)
MGKGEVVVITGASAGVGRATARAFARLGCRIGLLARGRDGLEAARREMQELGGEALVCIADVAVAEQVEAAAEKVEHEFGPIAVWVNNAMATVFAPFDEITPKEYRRSTEVTYLGCVHGTMSALRRMKARNRGTIVQVGSALSYRSIPLQSPYCGAKHAIVGFTDSLRSELLHDGVDVRLIVVHLPALNTPQFEWSLSKLPRQPQPVPPIYQPEIAADAIVWAAHHARREVCVGGPTVLAIEGQKIVPGLGDAYLAKTAYESQQACEKSPPDRPSNLFLPVAGDHGAHGRFDDRARDHSLQFWLNKNRSLLFAATGMAAAGLLAAKALRGTNHQHNGQVMPESNGQRSRPFGAAQNHSNNLFAWRGPAMLVVDRQGCAGNDDISGLYFRQARFLRTLRLELFGESPFVCSAVEAGANRLEFALVYPEKKGGGSDHGGEKNGIRYRDLDLRLSYEVEPDGLLATVQIANRWMAQVLLDVRWQVAADFADFDEVEVERRQYAATEATPVAGGVRFRYLHPQLPFETEIAAEDGHDWSFSGGYLGARIKLDRHAEEVIRLRVTTTDRADPIDREGALKRNDHLWRYRQTLTSIESPGPSPLAEIATRSMQDLASMAQLEGPENEWLAPGAGIPRYDSFWGRDALTAVWQASMCDRGQMAEATLNRVGRLQGATDDPWRDEQPGRTVRALQRSPLARLGITPFARYYGDYASPFDYIFALAHQYAWAGEKRLLQEHWDTARRIADWARGLGDIDGDGYLEYKTRSSGGPTHQGWRDSEDAIVYEDGSKVETPIATCEVQGYWFAAEQLMAVFAGIMGEPGTALAYWNAAKELKERFNRDYWMESEGYIALGLDPEKRLITSITSNPGHALATGIISDEHLPRVVRRLMAPDLFSGWGIRTLSSRNPAYNPLSYHLGSVWPVENATMVFGLRRFGFDREALRLARSLYDLALVWKDQRIPECVGGYAQSEATHPGAFPRANVPQAWNQSVFPCLVQTLLGIVPMAPVNLMAVDPLLPPWAPELILRNLRVGGACVTVRFWRDRDGASKYDVLAKSGTLHIVRQPSINSLGVGMWERLGALMHDTENRHESSHVTGRG